MISSSIRGSAAENVPRGGLKSYPEGAGGRRSDSKASKASRASEETPRREMCMYRGAYCTRISSCFVSALDFGPTRFEPVLLPAKWFPPVDSCVRTSAAGPSAGLPEDGSGDEVFRRRGRRGSLGSARASSKEALAEQETQIDKLEAAQKIETTVYIYIYIYIYIYM